MRWPLCLSSRGPARGRHPALDLASVGTDTHSFPAETRYFRKSFRVKEESRLAVDVTADNAFVLYLDGKPVAEGNDWATVQRVEAKLGVGPHVLAVRASIEAPGPAGLLLRGGVLPLGQGVPIQTDATWRSWDQAPEGDGWTKVGFDDRGWARAVDLGPLGSTNRESAGILFGSSWQGRSLGRPPRVP